MRAKTSGRGSAGWRFAALLFFLVDMPAAQASSTSSSIDPCTSLEVSGGGYNGTYEYNAATATYTMANGSYILQVMPIVDEGIRRTLSSDPLNEGRDQARLPRTAAAGDRAGALDRRRNLQDSACTTQMWIMVDEAKMVNGFPFYAAFDCAAKPQDIDENSWLFVDCNDCAVSARASVACITTTEDESVAGGGGDDDDNDDEFLSISVIAGIVVGATVFLCLVVGCCIWRCRKNPKGNNSFADDSEHSVRQKQVTVTGGVVGGSNMNGATAGPSEGDMGAWASISHNRSTDSGTAGGRGGAPPARTSVKGAHAAPMQLRNTSYQVAQEVHVYDTEYPARSGPSTHLTSSSSAPLQKDSMAAAAAAAAARSTNYTGSSTSGGDNGPPQQGGTVGFGEDVVIPRNGTDPNREKVVWSAGQNYVPEDHNTSGRHLATGKSYRKPAGTAAPAPLPGNYEDSAAASVFSLNPDNAPDHVYYDDASVPTSSPGGYSMYSHFTAGGHTAYSGGGNAYDQGEYSGEDNGSEDLSWDGEGEQLPLHSASKTPPPYRDPSSGGGAGGARHSHPPLAPLPTLEPVIAPESPITAQARQQQLLLQQDARQGGGNGNTGSGRQQSRRSSLKPDHRLRSPAGLVARADRSSRTSQESSHLGVDE